MKLVFDILRMLPAIIKAVKEVEAAFPAGSGKEKLSVVVKAIEASFGADGVEVSKSLIPAIEKVVGAVVAAFNTLGVFKK